MSKGTEFVQEFTVGVQALDESLPLCARVAIAIGQRVRRIEYEHRADPHRVLPMCFADTAFPAPGRTPPPNQHVYFEAWKPYESEPSDGSWEPLTLYGSLWSATGPLIDSLKISVVDDGGDATPWRAMTGFGVTPYETGYGADHDAMGKTPQEAICNLILLLATEGKLHWKVSC